MRLVRGGGSGGKLKWWPIYYDCCWCTCCRGLSFFLCALWWPRGCAEGVKAGGGGGVSWYLPPPVAVAIIVAPTPLVSSLVLWAQSSVKGFFRVENWPQSMSRLRCSRVIKAQNSFLRSTKVVSTQILNKTYMDIQRTQNYRPFLTALVKNKNKINNKVRTRWYHRTFRLIYQYKSFKKQINK